MNIILSTLNDNYIPDINFSDEFQQSNKVLEKTAESGLPVNTISHTSENYNEPQFNNIYSIILKQYYNGINSDYCEYITKYTLNMATKLDEEDLYKKYKFNGRSGLTKNQLQSCLQCSHSSVNDNYLSILYYAGDFLDINIAIFNGSEYINVSKIKSERMTIILSYNKNNKTYKTIEDPEFKLTTYKQYDYIDIFTGKKREEINSKLALDFGVRNDIKNVKTIYIANPLLKSITSYKLPELINLASELNINISDIKKVKKDIYNHMYRELNK